MWRPEQFSSLKSFLSFIALKKYLFNAPLTEVMGNKIHSHGFEGVTFAFSLVHADLILVVQGFNQQSSSHKLTSYTFKSSLPHSTLASDKV